MPPLEREKTCSPNCVPLIVSQDTFITSSSSFLYFFAVATTPEQEVDEEPAQAVGQGIQPSLGDVTISEVTPDSLLLSWSIREGNFDSFLIQYKDATRKLQVLPVDGAMRSLHLYNLTPSQRYEFSVYGISGHERLGPVSVDTVTG